MNDLAIRSYPPSGFWTPPLRSDFRTDGDWLLDVVRVAWRLPDGSPVVLDDWQTDLIKAILERRDDGSLRFRRVVVLVPRQSGKSLLGGILALYGLLRASGQLVVGVASSQKQATIVQQRTLRAIRSHPALAKRFKRATDTSGIETLTGSLYEVRPSTSGALQGLDVDLGLVDELHLLPEDLWSDLVTGTAAKPKGLVVGISTAGNADSELLLSLYRQRDAGLPDSFGWFEWRAPTDHVPEDPHEYRRWLTIANPAIACGRLAVELAVEDTQGIPTQDIARYRGNIQQTGKNTSWLPQDYWKRASGKGIPDGYRGPLVLSLDQTPGGDYASIVAVAKIEGHHYVDTVGAYSRWRNDALANEAFRLSRRLRQPTVAVASYKPALCAALEKRGVKVRRISRTEEVEACSWAYSALANQRVTHDDSQLLNLQVPAGQRKSSGTEWRITRNGPTDIDGLLALVYGLYVAEVDPTPTVQVFTTSE